MLVWKRDIKLTGQNNEKANYDFIYAVSMWLLEYAHENRTVQSASGEWTAVNSSYGFFFIAGLVLTFIYFIFLFEAKKDKSILNYSFWSKIPINFVIVGSLSVILFIVGGTIGPIMTWVEQWRSLLHVFFVYFLFLIFLFVFSFEHKKQKASQRSQMFIHISYIWTLLLFFVLYFYFNFICNNNIPFNIRVGIT